MMNLIKQLSSKCLVLSAVLFYLAPFLLMEGAPALAQQCVTPPSGLVSWWGGDNNALDMVGTNNGTSMNGATYAAGKVGQAFSFDGVDDFISVPYTPSLDFTAGDFSIDAWVYPTMVDTVGEGIAGRLASDNSSGWGFAIQGSVYGTAGKLNFFGNGGWVGQSDGTVATNTWTHVAITRSGNSLTYYINGNPSGSFTNGNFSGSFDNGLSLVMGDMYPSWAGSVWRFNGRIDEIEIFDHALSQAEIQAIYNAGSAGKCRSCTPQPSGMVSWWGGDNNALDMVGTNHGTLHGGATYAPGKVGEAFSFDGVEASYVEIPNSAEFNPSGAFSVDGWFYIDPAANAGKIATLIAKTEGSWGNGWAIYFDDRGIGGFSRNLQFIISGVAVFHNAIPVANWYHVAGVFDPSTTPNIKLYLNGTVVASANGSVGSSNDLNVRIGAMYWTDQYHQGNDRLNGKADEVEFFNRAFTAEEITAIYSAGGAGKCRSCVTPPSGMVSWWRAEANTNDSADGNTGALVNGATFAPGMVGQAFSLDGVDDYIQVPDLVNDMPQGTIQGWIRYNDNGPGILFSATSGVPLTGHYDVMILGVMPLLGTSIVFGIYPGGSSWYLADSGVVPNPDRWYHVAGTWGAGGVKIYVDGVLKGTHGYSGASSPANYNLIGASSWGYSVKGLIDEVELFNRALSAEEIASIYAAGSSGICFVPDTTPDPFTFTDQTGVPLNTLVESNAITVNGINTASSISITGGEYSVSTNNGATWSAYSTTTPLTVSLNDQVKVRQTSSSTFSTATDTTLTIGEVSDTFSLTTLAADTTPDAFAFVDQTGVPLNTSIESDIITVTGINTASPIFITGGEYSVSTNGGFTWSAYSASNPATVSLNHRVRVRKTSSSQSSTTTNTTLTIGGISDTFSVTTLDAVGPSLVITSHTNNQDVNTSRATLSGTASDSGRGDNGIQQVTVNGERANNDTATGSGTANWSKVVPLSPGANTLTIIAYDNSPSHNQTSQTITIYYDLISTIYVSKDNVCNGHSHCWPNIQNGISQTPDPPIIEITQDTYDGDIVLDVDKEIILEGGWDTNFTSCSSYTTIKGSMAIKLGTIIIENIILK